MVWKLRQERTCDSRNLACLDVLKDTQSAELGVHSRTPVPARNEARFAFTAVQLFLRLDRVRLSILPSLGQGYESLLIPDLGGLQQPFRCTGISFPVSLLIAIQRERIDLELAVRAAARFKREVHNS
jgi:hypothetical protein